MGEGGGIETMDFEFAKSKIYELQSINKMRLISCRGARREDWRAQLWLFGVNFGTAVCTIRETCHNSSTGKLTSNIEA